MKPYMLLLALSLIIYGCVTSDPYQETNTETVPSSEWRKIDAGPHAPASARTTSYPGWHEIDVGAVFRILAPSDFRYVSGEGFDSLVGSFIGPRIELNFDYGQYTSGFLPPPEKLTDTKSESLTINGRDAMIRTFSGYNRDENVYHISVYFPEATGTSRPEALTMGSIVKNMSDCELVRKIFETITFMP